MRHKFATRGNHDSSRHIPSRDLSSQVGFCLENQSLTWHWCDQKAILYLYVVVEQPIYLTIKCGDQIGSFVDFYNHAGYITYMIWMFPKIRVVTPKMDGENFMENPMNKWMIWEETPGNFWFNTHIIVTSRFCMDRFLTSSKQNFKPWRKNTTHRRNIFGKDEGKAPR